MELTDSKRLLYKASYVTTKLTPGEQQHIGSQAGGGYPKAYMMRLLRLRPQDLAQLRITMRTRGAPRHDSNQDKLFSIAEQLSTSSRAMSTMELAAAMAPIPQDALNNFVRVSSTVRASPASALLGALAQRRATISPIGRLHLERIEMYPAGVQEESWFLLSQWRQARPSRFRIRSGPPHHASLRRSCRIILKATVRRV